MKPASVSENPDPAWSGKLPLIARLSAGLLLVMTLGACRTPNITGFTATNSGGGALRAAIPATLTVNIKENGADIDWRHLDLTRLEPAGSSGSLTLAPGAVNGDIASYSSPVPATGGAVTFQTAERWRATASVRYYTPFGIPTTSKDFEFDVLEPADTFDFLTLPQAARWTLNGYFKNDAGQMITPVILEEFADANYPQPQARNHAIGFRIRPFNVSGWDYNDMWSAEFVSPPLHGQNAYVAWGGVRKYQVQARTDASGIKLQAILSMMDQAGNPRFFRMVTDSSQPIFFDVPSDDAWHSFNVDFSNIQLPSGFLLSVSLRVFGQPQDLPANDGKRVMIDHLKRE